MLCLRFSSSFFSFFSRLQVVCYCANYAALFGEVWGVWGLFGPPWLKLAVIGLLTAMQAVFFLTL